jgi:hypothetical protein
VRRAVGLFLALICGSVWAGQAALTWTAPTTNVDGTAANVTAYDVYMRCGTGAAARVATTPATARTYTVAAIPDDGRTCWFSLTANDATGPSRNTNEVSKTFPASTPTAPGSTTTVLTWTSTPITGYRYVRLTSTSEQNGNPWTSAAEVNLLDANGAVLPRTGWTVAADSAEGGNAASNAIDGNTATIWHTAYSSGPAPPQPHMLTIDMHATVNVTGLRYLPRQDGANGTIRGYVISESVDGQSWTQVAVGTFASGQALKTVSW